MTLNGVTTPNDSIINDVIPRLTLGAIFAVPGPILAEPGAIFHDQEPSLYQ